MVVPGVVGMWIEALLVFDGHDDFIVSLSCTAHGHGRLGPVLRLPKAGLGLWAMAMGYLTLTCQTIFAIEGKR